MSNLGSNSGGTVSWRSVRLILASYSEFRKPATQASALAFALQASGRAVYDSSFFSAHDPTIRSLSSLFMLVVW